MSMGVPSRTSAPTPALDQTFDIQIILGKVRPFLRRLAEAHPQVLIIAPVVSQNFKVLRRRHLESRRRRASGIATCLRLASRDGRSTAYVPHREDRIRVLAVLSSGVARGTGNRSITNSA
ncbi:MAG: hypothetical protein E6R06_14285 [Mycobacterium sp.]|nr:MAG: hypothetical protein E6R06_14285 [Mycobacterium sp.]